MVPPVPPAFNEDPDGSYWITIISFNPTKKMTLVGKLSETDRSIDIEKGSNPAGPSFRKVIELDDSGLVASGFTGDSNKYFSDTVEWWNKTTENYDKVYYDPNDSTWKDWDGTETAKHIEPGEGFWVVVQSWNQGITWTVPKPY